MATNPAHDGGPVIATLGRCRASKHNKPNGVPFGLLKEDTFDPVSSHGDERERFVHFKLCH
jgi:hypothetical protein